MVNVRVRDEGGTHREDAHTPLSIQRSMERLIGAVEELISLTQKAYPAGLLRLYKHDLAEAARAVRDRAAKKRVLRRSILKKLRLLPENPVAAWEADDGLETLAIWDAGIAPSAGTDQGIGRSMRTSRSTSTGPSPATNRHADTGQGIDTGWQAGTGWEAGTGWGAVAAREADSDWVPGPDWSNGATWAAGTGWDAGMDWGADPGWELDTVPDRVRRPVRRRPRPAAGQRPQRPRTGTSTGVALGRTASGRPASGRGTAGQVQQPRARTRVPEQPVTRRPPQSNRSTFVRREAPRI